VFTVLAFITVAALVFSGAFQGRAVVRAPHPANDVRRILRFDVVALCALLLVSALLGTGYI
jgi:hypothetical protein